MNNIYFANGNKFVPPTSEIGRFPIDSIDGKLISIEIKKGNSNSGEWVILFLGKDDESSSVYFDRSSVSDSDLYYLEKYKNRNISLRSQQGAPVINVIEVDCEGEIRAKLLNGVSEGHVKMEDLPALLAFSKGDDKLFEKWNQFKRQNDTEDLERLKEKIAKEYSDRKACIDTIKDETAQLNEVLTTVEKEKKRVCKELQGAMMFLQGEEYLEYSETGKMSIGCMPDNIVPIGEGFNNLRSAIEKLHPRKGVFLISGDSLYQVHSAFVEDKGRVYLMASSRQFKKTKPEQIQEIIDRIRGIYFHETPNNKLDSHE